MVVKLLRVALVVGAAGALMSGLAQAENVETAPAHDWSGLYVGAYGGVAWADADVVDEFFYRPMGNNVGLDGAFINSVGNVSSTDTVAAYGVQAGLNLQADKWVFGIQGDIGSLDLEASDSASGLFQPGSLIIWRSSLETQWMATIRGRVGFVPSDNLLVYGTGGAAVTRAVFHHSFNWEESFQDFPADISEKDTLWGWVAGAGIEWALTDRWSLGGEYLYTDFGKISGLDQVDWRRGDVVIGQLDDAVRAEVDLSVQTIRAFVNFKL